MDLEEMSAEQILERFLRGALPALGDPVTIRFTAAVAPYAVDERATFARPYARRLVDLQVASYA